VVFFSKNRETEASVKNTVKLQTVMTQRTMPTMGWVENASLRRM